MAKSRSWFNLLKRLFIVTGANSRTEKKDRRRRSWILFGRLKNKRLASLSAAPPSPIKKTQDVSEEQKQKSAMNVSATAALETSDEKNTAGEVAVRIRGCSPRSSTDECKKELQEPSPIKLHGPAPPKSLVYELGIHHLAATKIQSAFRGYLARKALKALKGLVRLQALVRGWAVRRQAMNTLKRLQTIVSIQTEVCAKRCDMVKGTPNNQENRLQDYFAEKDIKVDTNNLKRWDDSLLSKEEANAMSMSKRVAAIKRERIKEYWLNHRRSTESEQNRLSVKQRYWLEKWVDAQLAKRDDLQNIDEVFSSAAKNREEFNSPHIKLRNLQKHQVEAMDSPAYVPRRSFHQRKRSMGEDGCLGSPAVPTYMAATESARAKARSLSSPRLRPIPMDAYSEINSPYKHKLLSPISSINSEMTCNTQICRNINFSQRSPCLKSIPGPVKSNGRSIKDLRLISEYSLPN